MDLKQKLKSFINKQGQSPKTSPSSPPPLDPVLPNNFDSQKSVERDKEVELRDFPTDPMADQEVLESIDEVYFHTDQFDPSQYELNRIPEVLDQHVIHGSRQRILRQLTVVSKKVFQLILQNQSSCNEELTRVTELQSDLHETLRVCQRGRQQLRLAKRQFTTTSLGILANYRKRQLAMSLLHSLSTIKTLQRTDERLQELLEEEDYPGAIQLLLECQKAAATYRHFACISALSRKLQDTLVMTEEQLDVALARTCARFDPKSYRKLHTAYRLLGKTQTAMDQLHMHFTSAIHNTAFTIVHGYVELCASAAPNPDSPSETSSQKKQYSDLCKMVTSESFLPCLIDLCKSLWEIMNSYHKMMRWHSQLDDDMASSMDGPESDFTRKYVRQKLEHGRSRVWQDVQTKVRTYLLASDLSHFKFEDFLAVLEATRRLMDVGRDFCGGPAESLQESLKRQSASYFRSYHRNSLDQLRVFLENEAWEICPLKAGFNIMQLHEMRLLGDAPGDTVVNSPNAFNTFADEGTPFDTALDDTQEEDILAPGADTMSSDSDEDVPDELKCDYVDERTGEPPKQRRRHHLPDGPILTNTALFVLRLCGKYLQMMRLLQPVASDVLASLSQLFDYYLYAVATFFSPSGQMRPRVLARIQEWMSDTVSPPCVSPAVDLTTPERLYGLKERTIGVESLVFIATQFGAVRPYIESTVPTTARAMVQQFMASVGVAEDMRKPVYQAVATRAVDFDNVMQMMSKVNWDVREVVSQHSTYVDVLLRDLQVFTMRLEEVSRRTPIPKEAYTVLWNHVIRFTNHVLVEGFASTKKCSQGGRALMQLDFIQFVSKLEKITEVRPIPEREFVENFIKAYYIPENNMEDWIKEHTEYSTKHLGALVTCAHQNNKKARQRLFAVIEEVERTRR